MKISESTKTLIGVAMACVTILGMTLIVADCSRDNNRASRVECAAKGQDYVAIADSGMCVPRETRK